MNTLHVPRQTVQLFDVPGVAGALQGVIETDEGPFILERHPRRNGVARRLEKPRPSTAQGLTLRGSTLFGKETVTLHRTRDGGDLHGQITGGVGTVDVFV